MLLETLGQARRTLCRCSQAQPSLSVPVCFKTLTIYVLPTGWVYSKEVVVIPTDDMLNFAVFQNNAHALWARRFSSTLELRLSYSISDALRTFPLACDRTRVLRAAGEAYFDQRRNILCQRRIGLTTVYNLFHDRTETAEDIRLLREMHAAM